jgi:hypothetical protein
VLVQQRKFHESKSTVKAIRQVNRLAGPVSVTGTMTTKNVVEHTPVRDVLMKRLAQLVPAETKQNTTIGFAMLAHIYPMTW